MLSLAMILVACGGTSPAEGPADAGVDGHPADPDAGPGPDAAPTPDAPPGTPQIVVTSATGAAITEVTFDDADDLTLTVRNSGAAPTAALVVAVTGDAHDDVVLDAGSTCSGQVLAATASCTIVMHYLPQTELARTGALRITGGVTLEVALHPVLSPALLIRFAGTALGVVRAEHTTDSDTTELRTCRSSCRVRAAAGDVIQLIAATPSRFGGITGACTAMAPDGGCQVTLGTGIQVVTVT
ncbi:MAG: hypothetical protein ABIY55_26320, partial [Kofleriaceae bacterium]